MKIKLSDINQKPCEKYYNYIIETYGAEGEFDPIDVFENVICYFCPPSDDIGWLIINCPKCQTNEIFEYLKKFESTSWFIFNIGRLIRTCEFFQTKEMVEYYEKLCPNAYDINFLKDEILKDEI